MNRLLNCSVAIVLLVMWWGAKEAMEEDSRGALGLGQISGRKERKGLAMQFQLPFKFLVTSSHSSLSGSSKGVGHVLLVEFHLQKGDMSNGQGVPFLAK